MGTINLHTHPCFDPKARHTYSRIHVPVAPRCNVQCNYCNRKYDCMNESRPGVSSGVLKPRQALEYIQSNIGRVKNLSVVGIAGPGDPMANPDETLETFRLIRKEFPELLLCLATNGLNLPPYLDELQNLQVSHVTVTVNAVDARISKDIYAWMRYGRRSHNGQEAAEYLLEQQKTAIAGLSERGIIAKVNCILMPGVNDHHISSVAETVAGLGAHVLNVMPLMPVSNTPFFELGAPDDDLVQNTRTAASKWLPQMRHCSRCRADAAGLIGQENSFDVLGEIRKFQKMGKEISIQKNSARPHIAVTSREDMLVNLHLGEASRISIFSETDTGEWQLLEHRLTPPSGYGDKRWKLLGESLTDCQALFVASAGQRPIQVLQDFGLPVFKVEGLISDICKTLSSNGSLERYHRNEAHACGVACSGTGAGCG